MTSHHHEFTALWYQFGPYGRQDVHVHPCFTNDCDRVVIGAGRDCSKSAGHHRETLTCETKAQSETSSANAADTALKAGQG